MDNHDFSNIGQQIKSMVQDAINTMDFKKLNQDIGSTVNSALNELKEGIRSAGQGARPEAQRPKTPPVNVNAAPPPVARSQAYINPKPAGSVSGVLCIVFGAIGLGFAGIALAVSTIVGAVNNSLAALGGTALGYIAPLAVLCGCLMTRGVYLRKRVARFRQYTRQLRGRTYCQVKELADHIGKSVKFVAKDVRKMIRLGMFPEGRLDDQQSCLMLNDETYQQYVDAQEAHKQKMAQAKEGQAVLSPEDRAVIEEGRRYIAQIREMNDASPGEEVSAQLEQLEMVTSKIFSHVERHPEQIPEIRKFMAYYLPTTLKLVKAYREFDSQTIEGETISSAKAEIQNTLDTINMAFVKLLDSLFEDAAFDISTDITVLQTMLAQEGLTKKDFG